MHTKKLFIRYALLFSASLLIQNCCTKSVKIPPRVDGDNITLENARKGYYNLVVQMEACELCDADRDLADAVSENAEEIFELRSDELLSNEEYNAYIESIQAKLMDVRRICNTLAISGRKRERARQRRQIQNVREGRGSDRKPEHRPRPFKNDAGGSPGVRT